MIEKAFKMTLGNDRIVEKVIGDENLHYMHMILNKNEGLPEHNTNSTVYLTVLRGTLTIGLQAEEPRVYPAGSVLKIPMDTKMNVKNLYEETLELTVVKAPAPNMI